MKHLCVQLSVNGNLFLSCSTQIWKQRWREHTLDFNVPRVLCLEPAVPFMSPSSPMKDGLPCLPGGAGTSGTMPELPKLPAAPRLRWGLVPCMLSMTAASSQAAVKSGCFSGSTWPATHLVRAPSSAINVQQFFLALSISAKGLKQGAEQCMTTEHGL